MERKKLHIGQEEITLPVKGDKITITFVSLIPSIKKEYPENTGTVTLVDLENLMIWGTWGPYALKPEMGDRFVIHAEDTR